jgi:hypothetical protein
MKFKVRQSFCCTVITKKETLNIMLSYFLVSLNEWKLKEMNRIVTISNLHKPFDVIPDADKSENEYLILHQ